MEEQELKYSASDIADAVERVAASIGNDYEDLSRLVLVGVMDGAIFFLADLMRELRQQALGERVEMATARLESYQGTGPEGVKCIWLPSQNRIEARDVLIVEDIVATGETCSHLKSKLMEMGAKSVKICTLLYNSGWQKCTVEVDYFGFEVPHVAWVGYGLDFKGVDRNLPCVYADFDTSGTPSRSAGPDCRPVSPAARRSLLPAPLGRRPPTVPASRLRRGARLGAVGHRLRVDLPESARSKMRLTMGAVNSSGSSLGRFLAPSWTMPLL